MTSRTGGSRQRDFATNTTMYIKETLPLLLLDTVCVYVGVRKVFQVACVCVRERVG